MALSDGHGNRLDRTGSGSLQVLTSVSEAGIDNTTGLDLVVPTLNCRRNQEDDVWGGDHLVLGDAGQPELLRLKRFAALLVKQV